jgi:hypothetical protein
MTSVLSNRYLVYFRPKTGMSQVLRVASHVNHLGVSEKEFRLTLIKLYVKHKRRLIKIERV